jgi:probable F420-dependent oxidoreductase
LTCPWQVYIAVQVELEEGSRILSKVSGVANDEVRFDLPVEVWFDDVTDEVTLPKLRLRRWAGHWRNDMADKIGFGAFYRRSPDSLSVTEFAKRVEDLGFDGLWTGESPTNRGASLDTFATLCFAAAATSRITVGSDVLLLPLHDPAWVAKQWSTLDVLSGGRSVLGVGVGGEYVKQFEAFGVPVAERGRRTDEGLEVIKSLWSEGESAHAGRFWQFDGITMEPRPVQQPHPPIWVGGRPARKVAGPDGTQVFPEKTGAMYRAAKYGNGWDPYYVTVDGYRESVEQIRLHARDLKRDISQMTWALTTFWLMRDSYDEALEAAKKKLRYGRDLSDRVARYDIVGSGSDTIRRLEQYVEAGARYFICNWSCELDEVPWHLERIAREVIPHFQ